MKTIFSALVIGLLISVSALAADLTTARTVIVHPRTELRIWSKVAPVAPLSVTAFGLLETANMASCTLDLSLDTLQGIASVVNTEVKDEGSVYSLNMVRDYYLFVTDQTSEVLGGKAPCNGEPELCSQDGYTQSSVTLKLIDSRQNRSILNCVSDLNYTSKAKPPLQLSDANISGVEVK